MEAFSEMDAVMYRQADAPDPQAAGPEKKPAVVATARPPEQPCRAQPDRQHAPVQAADRKPAQEEKRKAEPAQKQDPARKAAAEGKGEETAVQSLTVELSTLEAYTPLQILVDDCTPEKLSALLAVHPGGLLTASPEGGIFQMMKGTRDRPPNLDVYLKVWGNRLAGQTCALPARCMPPRCRSRRRSPSQPTASAGPWPLQNAWPAMPRRSSGVRKAGRMTCAMP